MTYFFILIFTTMSMVLCSPLLTIIKVYESKKQLQYNKDYTLNEQQLSQVKLQYYIKKKFDGLKTSCTALQSYNLKLGSFLMYHVQLDFFCNIAYLILSNGKLVIIQTLI